MSKKINYLLFFFLNILFIGIIVSCDDDVVDDSNTSVDVEGVYYKLSTEETSEANKLFDSLDGTNWVFKAGWPLEGNLKMKLSVLNTIKHITTKVVDSTFTDDSTIYELSITALNLSYNGLVGILPNFNLKNLDTLNLGNNDLEGNIPDINLPNLTFVNFSHNKYTGEVPNFSSDKLKYIDLNYNFLTGQLPPLIKESIIALDVSSNEISGSLDNLNLPNLERLDISDNNFEGDLPNYNFPKLKTLVLSNNKFTGTIHSFGENPDLIKLDISDNLLEGSIENLIDKNLNHLNLANNNLSGNVPKFTKTHTIKNDEGNDTTLLVMQNLYLAYNNFNFADLEPNAGHIYNYSYESQKFELILEEKDNNILSAKMTGVNNTYQWYKDNVILDGENGEEITTDTGEYYCIVSNTALPNLKFKSNIVLK